MIVFPISASELLLAEDDVTIDMPVILTEEEIASTINITLWSYTFELDTTTYLCILHLKTNIYVIICDL